MATLWIREYSALGEDGNGRFAQIGQEPGVASQVVSFITSQSSAAFNGATRYIAIYGSAAFHYRVSATPVAVTTDLPVPATTLLYVGVRPGDKIAAIAG